MSIFRFKQFSVQNEKSALKVGTDAVLLGAEASLPEGNTVRCLDIGTGTGVIALMIAQRLSCAGKDGCIEAIDIDEPSCSEAAANFAASPWSEMLSVRHIALQELSGRNYDMIISNPPFYDGMLTNPDPRKSRARHSDTLSYKEITAFAADNLQEGGQLSLIVPAECEKALLSAAVEDGLHLRRIIHIRTTARKGVRRIIAEFARSKTAFNITEEQLTLHEGDGRSPEYQKLTEEFYL